MHTDKGVSPASVDNEGVSGWQRYSDLCNWWYTRMATTTTPLVEKMTLFWHGHFTSSQPQVGNLRWMYDQNALFRSQGLGDVHRLTQGMAIQPAMLTYLQNRTNVKGGAQNNFARELMELFTMGPGNYSESDVMEVGRAWTGHTVNDATKTYQFVPGSHDEGSKKIFGITKNWNGPDVIDEIFTNPTKQRAVARLIVKKLWTFFAYPNPDDVIVTTLVTTLIDNRFNIASVLRSMFLSDDFYSQRAMQALVRTPTEFVVAVMRGTGISAADLHPEWYSLTMGQALFQPPNVAGWGSGQDWLTSSTMSGRALLAERAHWSLSALGTHPFARSNHHVG